MSRCSQRPRQGSHYVVNWVKEPPMFDLFRDRVSLTAKNFYQCPISSEIVLIFNSLCDNPNIVKFCSPKNRVNRIFGTKPTKSKYNKQTKIWFHTIHFFKISVYVRLTLCFTPFDSSTCSPVSARSVPVRCATPIMAER